MLKYVVENTREESVTVDGLGVLPPKVVRDVSEAEELNFRYMRGLPLAAAQMPEGVTVTITVMRGKE